MTKRVPTLLDLRTSAFRDECDKPSELIGMIHIPAYVTGYHVECIVDAAFSGDSNLWINTVHVVKDVPETKCMAEKIGKGGTLELMVDAFLPEHNDKPVSFTLTAAHVISGLQQFAMCHQFTGELGDIDASDADAILQYGIFNELIFG